MGGGRNLSLLREKIADDIAFETAGNGILELTE